MKHNNEANDALKKSAAIDAVIRKTYPTVQDPRVMAQGKKEIMAYESAIYDFMNSAFKDNNIDRNPTNEAKILDAVRIMLMQIVEKIRENNKGKFTHEYDQKQINDYERAANHLQLRKIDLDALTVTSPKKDRKLARNESLQNISIDLFRRQTDISLLAFRQPLFYFNLCSVY